MLEGPLIQRSEKPDDAGCPVSGSSKGKCGYSVMQGERRVLGLGFVMLEGCVAVGPDVVVSSVGGTTNGTIAGEGGRVQVVWERNKDDWEEFLELLRLIPENGRGPNCLPHRRRIDYTAGYRGTGLII